MRSFLLTVLESLKDNGEDLTSLTYILPSKRAGAFLKKELATLLKKTTFVPEILAIETFTEELSQLKKQSNSDLLFSLYKAYLTVTDEKNVEPFDSFVKWGQILLQDFNEIDRYLVPHDKLFDYLNAIEELNHWSKTSDQTKMITNYLKFWDSLPSVYESFKEVLTHNNFGYQGLIYREAVENLETYIQNSPRKKHIFMGFNALNRAEETIIQELLENNLASVFWDIDAVFMENKIHDAGMFLRNYKHSWRYFRENPFQWTDTNYSSSKSISTYGIPKNTGQAKQIGALLKSMLNDNPGLQNTAVVLADESLLIPVLNSLPTEIKELNVTMGFPLNKTPLATTFEHILKLHSQPVETFYYKDIITLLSNPNIRQLYYMNTDLAGKMIQSIEDNNFVYLTPKDLNELSNNIEINLVLFSNWKNSPELAIENCKSLILRIKEKLTENKNSNLLNLEQLFRFNEIFNELQRLNDKDEYIKDIKTLLVFFKELMSNESLDFQGEPLHGLQIMGMLETRVLDFENVIIASVNEGFLPSGKSNNSFIPYDVKIEYGLPTYKEKDAIYAYHFYHLLQRSKNIHILYNTEVDALNGGEKSRFIYQLQVEGKHTLNEHIILPKTPMPEKHLKAIKKTPLVIDELQTLASKGFSPSSLTTYIRNPIDFYYQKLLGIKEHEEVEETIAYNTLGTIVHNTLEDFYLPFVGFYISVKDLESLLPQIDNVVSHHFKEVYKSGDISKGKNLIIFEVAKRYVYNFLKQEIRDLNNGHSIKILGVELNTNMFLEDPKLPIPIKISGKIDRLDLFDGVTRIIDYKTGKVDQSQVQVTLWEDIITDYTKYSKPFQLLLYALLLNYNKEIKLPVEAGIFSFKNLNIGLLKFSKKDPEHSRAPKDNTITQETLDAFQEQLILLLNEIYNPTFDFIEKEV